jgi:Tol biopolymer transport system component
MVMNLETKEIDPLTNGEAPILEATFTPDGQTIYYIEGKEYGPELAVPTYYDLFSIKTDGTDKEKLNMEPIFLMESLSISPDGETLYFSATDTEKFQPLFQSIDVNQPTKIETYPIGEHSNPIVSPNGEFIYYSTPSEHYEQSFEYEVFSYHMKSGERKQLTTEKSALFAPTFLHTRNAFAVFEQVNWPDHPAKYVIKIFSIDGEPIREIHPEIIE